MGGLALAVPAHYLLRRLTPFSVQRRKILELAHCVSRYYVRVGISLVYIYASAGMFFQKVVIVLDSKSSSVLQRFDALTIR